jgi:4-amino-4-deoxy-L-arabinose transferase-like glycosyltransferase
MNKLVLLIILSSIVYFSNLGGNSIYILDEAKNAGCAMEMKDRGDWIVPTFNNQLRTDKPPLHYFFMMASYSVFGATPFAARFFSALAGILLILLVYKNVKHLMNESVAFYTALILLSSIQLTIQFHLAVPDPYLILLIALSLFSFFKGYHVDSKQLKWFYIASALGFLCKGLVAIVLPGLIIVLYLILTQSFNWTTLKQLKMGIGIILFCVLALPWYAAVGLATDGEWLKGFFLEHNLERYTSTMEGHRGFPLAPFVILIVALLPFSVFIVQAVRLAWIDRKEKPLLLFCLIVSVVFAGFFSFSKTILPSYPAPAIPFLAIVIGYYFNQLKIDEKKQNRSQWISLSVNVLIVLILFVAAYIALKQEPAMNDLMSSIWIFLILPIGSLAGWYFFTKKKFSLFIFSWSGSWIVLGLLFFYVTYPLIDQKNPVTASLPLIKQAHSSCKIVGYKIFNPAYVFTLHQTIEVANTPEALKELTKGEAQVIVITRGKYQNEVPQDLKMLYRGKDLFEKNETILLTNGQ